MPKWDFSFSVTPDNFCCRYVKCRINFSSASSIFKSTCKLLVIESRKDGTTGGTNKCPQLLNGQNMQLRKTQFYYDEKSCLQHGAAETPHLVKRHVGVLYLVVRQHFEAAYAAVRTEEELF